MWGEVLGWALFVSVNPLLLGFILVVISRPRPVPNLIAFWVGCLIVNLPGFLVPLVLLHLNPRFSTLALELTRPATAAGSTFRPIPLATGVLALLIAAILALRLLPRKPSEAPPPGSSRRLLRRHRAEGRRAQPSAAAGDSPISVMEAKTSPANPGPLGRAKNSVLRLGSAIRRLLAGAQNSWESGSVWVSFVAGLGYLPPPPLVLIVGLAIVGSGAAIGSQVSVAIVFVLAMLWVVEIILISCLIAPSVTQKILGPVNDWLQTYRRHVLITLFALVGVWQVATGLGVA